MTKEQMNIQTGTSISYVKNWGNVTGPYPTGSNMESTAQRKERESHKWRLRGVIRVRNCKKEK